MEFPTPQVMLEKVNQLPVDWEGLYTDIATLQLARFDQHDEDADVLNVNDYCKALFMSLLDATHRCLCGHRLVAGGARRWYRVEIEQRQ